MKIALKLFVVLIISILLMAGCSKDESNPSAPQPPANTQTITMTSTPADTGTPTYTYTITETSSATVTFTITNTSSESPTFTETLTASATPTITETHTAGMHTVEFTSVEDTYINYDVTTAPLEVAMGGLDAFFVGSTTVPVSQYQINRTLLKFNCAFDTTGKTIISAVLTLYCDDASPGNTITAYALTRSWVEGNALSEINQAGASWQRYDILGAGVWTTPGGDYNPSPISDSVPVYWTSIGYMNWNLDVNTVKAWMDTPATNYGMILIGAYEGDVLSETYYLSSEYSDSAYHPKLTVTYYQ